MAHQLLLDLGEKLQDDSVSDADKKRVLQAMVEKVELFPERLENGRYVKGITFNFPVMLEGEMTDQWWYKENPVETVLSLSQQKPDDIIQVGIDLDDMDVTPAESKASYGEIKQYVLEHTNQRIL